MLKLSDFDREVYKEACEADALENIKGHEIKGSERVFIGCSDGDQIDDLWRHHCKVHETSRHHPFLLNGLPLLLSPYSPLSRAREIRPLIIGNIAEAAFLKEMREVVIITHCPCGIAYAKNLNLLEVWRLCLEGKNLIESTPELANLRVSCFCHVDVTVGSEVKKRTRFINKKKMTAYLLSKGLGVRG